MKKEVKKVIETSKEIVGVLKKMKEVKAIAFRGGIGKGYIDQWSDIDIICLCSPLPTLRSRKKEFEKKGIKIKSIKLKHLDPRIAYHYRDMFAYKNIGISIDYYPLNRLRKKPERIKARDYLIKEDIKAVLDPANIFKANKKVIDESVKKLDALARFFWAKLLSFSKDKGRAFIKKYAKLRKDKIWVNKQFQIWLDWYMFCLYTMNGLPYSEFSSKWAYKKIKIFKYKPAGCIGRLERIAILGNSPKELKEKLNLISSLIKETTPLIEKKFGIGKVK